MRLDRILSEGEAINALQRMGFVINESANRRGLYDVTHADVGGARTFTVEQLCSFAEGASVMDAYAKSATARA